MLILQRLENGKTNTEVVKDVLSNSRQLQYVRSKTGSQPCQTHTAEFGDLPADASVDVFL
jgi:hypothetical protein